MMNMLFCVTRSVDLVRTRMVEPLIVKMMHVIGPNTMFECVLANIVNFCRNSQYSQGRTRTSYWALQRTSSLRSRAQPSLCVPSRHSSSHRTTCSSSLSSRSSRLSIFLHTDISNSVEYRLNRGKTDAAQKRLSTTFQRYHTRRNLSDIRQDTTRNGFRISLRGF